MSQPGQEPAVDEPVEPTEPAAPHPSDPSESEVPDGGPPGGGPPGGGPPDPELETTDEPGPPPFWDAFAPLRQRYAKPLLWLAAALVLLLILVRRILGRRASETARSEEDGGELPRMSFWDHLDELRRRLTTTVLIYSVAFLVCWGFAKPIYAFLARPIEALLGEGEKLVFLKVTDPFFLYMQVGALAAAFVAAPLIFYQVWGFIEPGLYKEEKSRIYRLGVPFSAFATVLFVAGGAFGYTIAFPFALEFFLGIGTPFEAAVTVQSYFGFMMAVILGLGLMFELPAVILLLAWLGVVTPGFLLRQSRAAIVIIFIAAAIITPTPDVFNLCLFAFPTIALYFLGILLAWFVRPKDAKSETDETALQKTS